MGSLTEIEDKLAIQELMAQYNFAINFGDIEGWANCFTEEGIFECPFGLFTGRTALRQYISERTGERRERPLRHMATNIIVEVKGDRASAKCYLFLLQVVPEGLKLLTTGVYRDELRKIGGAWHFSHRNLKLDSKAWGSQVFPASYLQKSESEERIVKSG